MSEATEESNAWAEIANEVYSDSSIEVDNSVTQTQQPVTQETQQDIDPNKEEQVIDDPWSSVPEVLKSEFEGLKSKLSQFENIEYRLKQAESRVGSVVNELSAAKKAAEATKNAPSAKQIEAAQYNSADWDELKADFPEWADATENRLAAQRSEILSQMPDIGTFKSQLQEEYDGKLGDIRNEMLGSVVSLKHKDWQSTVAQEDFTKWFNETGQSDSWNPTDIINTLDNWAEYKKAQKSPDDIIAERKARLEQSQTQKSSAAPTRREKSEEDMTADELRQLIAREIWQT